uniref:Reverse transcriptase domain-containing protein n=1 Tax=Aegilops tauschii subsp. strangulata TaxID=200361 RepID=A0A453KU06_AEGTS
MDTEWELKFPMVTVRALKRIEALSDHASIILDSNSVNPAARRPFKFELGWLHRDGFVDIIKNVWEKPAVGRTPIQRWNFKIRAMRQHLAGWAKHTNGIYKKEKQRLSTIIDDLDKIAETRTLSQQEIELKNQSNEKVARLLREEEIKYYQRSKADLILMGDSNTRYFQLIANGRHRKKCIYSLQQDEGLIEGQEELKKYITKYYKSLFGAPAEGNFTLDETRTDDIPQVTAEENDILTAPFSEEEVRAAVFQMEHNKAPGPDGFPAEFYQNFWDIIKTDLLKLFNCLHADQLDLFKLNFGEIVLLPKIKEAERIQQFRPICLLNVSFKIFTKVNMSGVVFKIDFEKAYDKVKWSFLQQALRMKGFSDKWRQWIQNFVTGGSVAIKVNDDLGHYFQTKKGLRQGDPMSPMLFNIVVDMLAILIERAKQDGQIAGVVP